ncbi:LysE family translocator [Stappia sp.]|uniref:LysE family translocator n=1 Tax=Stappia sp. TaxID=1870903 RepID=UPI003A98D607
MFFFIGMAIGLATSAPVGPVNIAAVERALRHGFVPGLLAGLGAVLADGVYASFAAFGITAVSEFVEANSDIIQFVGALLLIGFGVRVLRSHPHLSADAPGKQTGMISAFFTCFAITITNPGVVLGFLAIFGSLGKWAPDPGDYTGAAFMVAGVVSGALGWWVLVSATVSHLRGRMTDAWLDWMNRISGLALVAFGLGIFAHLAYAAWS